jgi:hypothetical protein
MTCEQGQQFREIFSRPGICDDCSANCEPRNTPRLVCHGLAHIYLDPVIADIRSWLQFGERPAPAELAGMSRIGIALALISWLSIQRQERSEPMMAQE